ncbi:outer membrane beta-barrel protein [Jeongeupia naejangsanensis]|uniref:Outer membrane beta-barrel protein n=1 Tax=Jeongeupia naejangsanensis TaxID=613195 RepID=A0ABS2BMS1_9NEIS|nr:outer membrane beta-barrel protein [Jeongeupia naejangsanensis]MBM3116363.1 outer membrane beta-barrel protein [Jeongeupia naejangsanensis]
MPGHAGSVFGQLGATSANAPEENSYGWAIGYDQPLGETLSMRFAWLNEGHVSGHRRDGQALQLWAGLPLGGGWRLAAGAGPYYYYDTQNLGDGYRISHGWGGLYSAALQYESTGGWIWALQYNRIEARDGFDTNALLLQLGYRLDGAPAGAEDGPTGRQEVALLLGAAIVNNLDSPNSFSGGVAYSFRFADDWAVSAMWLDEVNTDVLRRQGIVAQLWYEPDLGSDRFSIGVGIGPYYATRLDDMNGSGAVDDDKRWAGLVSLGAGYRLAGPWMLRAAWHRVLTSYSRDSDVLQLGLGYRF